jgi:hypothetical protein
MGKQINEFDDNIEMYSLRELYVMRSRLISVQSVPFTDSEIEMEISIREGEVK